MKVKAATTQSSTHTRGVTVSAPQKIHESAFPICDVSSSDSYTHSLVPSSLILFHHRSPTMRRPVMFFTVQKSKTRKRTTRMKERMKLDVAKPQKRYVKSAAALKKTWKKAVFGWAVVRRNPPYPLPAPRPDSRSPDADIDMDPIVPPSEPAPMGVF